MQFQVRKRRFLSTRGTVHEPASGGPGAHGAPLLNCSVWCRQLKSSGSEWRAQSTLGYGVLRRCNRIGSILTLIWFSGGNKLTNRWAG